LHRMKKLKMHKWALLNSCWSRAIFFVDIKNVYISL